MKLKSFLSLGVVMAGIIFISLSCKKSSDSGGSDPTPDYPQLIGGWFGLTSDNDTVNIVVSNVGGYLKITTYEYKVIYISGSSKWTHWTRISNSQGLCNVTNKAFALIPEMSGGSPTDTLSGTFNVTNLTLAGNIKATFTEVTGNPVVRVTYAATKMSKR